MPSPPRPSPFSTSTMLHIIIHPQKSKLLALPIKNNAKETSFHGTLILKPTPKACALANIFNGMKDKYQSGNSHVEIIMRDRTHSEQVIRWAKYVKSHPRSVWIKEVKLLIDSQIIMANNFLRKILSAFNNLATKTQRHREKNKQVFQVSAPQFIL